MWKYNQLQKYLRHMLPYLGLTGLHHAYKLGETTLNGEVGGGEYYIS